MCGTIVSRVWQIVNLDLAALTSLRVSADNVLYLLKSAEWRLLDLGIVANIGEPCS